MNVKPYMRKTQYEFHDGETRSKIVVTHCVFHVEPDSLGTMAVAVDGVKLLIKTCDRMPFTNRMAQRIAETALLKATNPRQYAADSKKRRYTRRKN